MTRTFAELQQLVIDRLVRLDPFELPRSKPAQLG